VAANPAVCGASPGLRVARDPANGQLFSSVKIGTFSTASGTPFQGMRVAKESVLNSPGINVAPRIGFAYNLTGDGKTSLRGGFGMFYDRFNDDQVLQLIEAPPNVITSTANFTTINALLSTPLSVSPAGVFSINPDYAPPAVYNYSLGIQRDIGFKTVLDVAYVGSQARHLLQRRSINSVPYGARFLPSSIDQTVAGGATPLPDNFLRPYKGYGDINLLEFASNSNYNALQVQLNRRISTSLAFGLAYTWSKAMDLIDDNNTNINPFIDPSVRNYGKAGFDRTHIFTFNYVYKLPNLLKSWDSRLGRSIFDGWELSGITSFISGSPLGIGYGLSPSADLVGGSGGGVDSRVVLTGDPNLPNDQRTPTRAFDTSVVQAPSKAGFGIGNAPKDAIRGPGINNWDISIFKNFKLARDGGVSLQYRLEMYNAFNHTQFSGVNTTAQFDPRTGAQTNTRFGEYNAARDPRRIVMGLKINF
jgi:hypothetical protein